jgi:RNA polymerase-binding transcription factor DksA
MTSRELEKYREKLLALRGRLRGDLENVRAEALRQSGGESSGNLSNVPMHLADLGTDNFEQEVALSLVEKEQAILDQIGPALEHIEQRTFGRCTECGRRIAPERLQALPYTPYCVECAARLEQQG